MLNLLALGITPAIRQNNPVKIIDKNGTVTEAVLLSRQGETLRVAVPGAADVCEFTRLGYDWITEEGEPVAIEFEWQRIAVPEVPREEDCICPQELAARLRTNSIGTVADQEERDPELDTPSVDGTKVQALFGHLTVQ